MYRRLLAKFAAVVALMDGSSYPHERITAREKAERIAEDLGMPFETALLMVRHRNPCPLPPTRAEAEAEIAAARAAADAEEGRRQARDAALVDLTALYGSLDVAEAPCWRERALVDAVARWRVTHPAPYDRWTYTIAGGTFEHKLPDDVRRAIRRAVPWPESFAEARAEIAYWKLRAGEYALLFDEVIEDGNLERLDLVVQMRADMIYKLIAHDLEVQTVYDLEQKVDAITETGGPDEGEWTATCEAIHRLANSERAGVGNGIPSSVASRVRSELRRDEERKENRSDRAIARLLGCSPTTVGKMRRVIAEGKREA